MYWLYVQFKGDGQTAICQEQCLLEEENSLPHFEEKRHYHIFWSKEKDGEYCSPEEMRREVTEIPLFKSTDVNCGPGYYLANILAIDESMENLENRVDGKCGPRIRIVSRKLLESPRDVQPSKKPGPKSTKRGLFAAAEPHQEGPAAKKKMKRVTSRQKFKSTLFESESDSGDISSDDSEDDVVPNKICMALKQEVLALKKKVKVLSKLNTELQEKNLLFQDHMVKCSLGWQVQLNATHSLPKPTPNSTSCNRNNHCSTPTSSKPHTPAATPSSSRPSFVSTPRTNLTTKSATPSSSIPSANLPQTLSMPLSRHEPTPSTSSLNVPNTALPPPGIVTADLDLEAGLGNNDQEDHTQQDNNVEEPEAAFGEVLLEEIPVHEKYPQERVNIAAWDKIKNEFSDFKNVRLSISDDGNRTYVHNLAHKMWGVDVLSKSTVSGRDSNANKLKNNVNNWEKNALDKTEISAIQKALWLRITLMNEEKHLKLSALEINNMTNILKIKEYIRKKINNVKKQVNRHQQHTKTSQ